MAGEQQLPSGGGVRAKKLARGETLTANSRLDTVTVRVSIN